LVNAFDRLIGIHDPNPLGPLQGFGQETLTNTAMVVYRAALDAIGRTIVASQS